jgi:hypothetical protein
MKSIDSFTIKNRGTVYIVPSPIGGRARDLAQFIGTQMEIDGVLRTIKGYENHPTLLTLAIKIGDPVGLLVG